MSSKLFFVNIFDGIDSLSVTPIAEKSTNIDLEIKTAYVRDIYNADQFNSTNMLNNSDIKNFYYNIILESLNLSNTAESNQSFKFNLQQLKSDFKDLYILSRYKNPSKKSCVSIANDGTINTADLIGNFKIYNVGKESLDTITFGIDGSNTFSDDRANSVYAEVREYDGIFLSKSFVQLSLVTTEAYPWDYNGISYSDISEKILTSFNKCKVYVYVVKNFDFTSNQYYYSSYILILRNAVTEYQYAQDFTNVASFSTAYSLHLNKVFYPFSVIVDNASIEKGSLPDPSLANLAFDFPSICLGSNDEINTDTSADTLPLNTMACDLGGNIMIQYNSGPVVKLRDDQICSGPAKVAYLRIDSTLSDETFLYKDLPNLGFALTIYGYNFSYIKYIKSDGSTEVLVGSAPVKTSTQKYSGETIKMGNYFAYNFDSSYGDKSFTFSYKFEADNGSDTTEYLLDLRPTIKIPSIQLNLLADDKVQVVSNYATNLVYYFESGEPFTIAVTDTANGTNQISTISTVGKYGTLHVEARNFFYDLDTEQSGIFAASESIEIKKTITISSLQLRLYRGASLVNFYDSNGQSLSEISGTDFAQGSVLNYVYYRASTNSSDFRFRLNYTFDGALSIRVGAYDLYEMASGDYYTLTVDQLFATLDESGKANVSVVLPDGTEFVFPFTFKNTYTTTPSVSSVTIDSVTFLDANLASLSFSYAYSQAEKILYEVKNQNGDTINSSTVNVQYSASSASETVTVDSLSVSNASSITVSVTASSLSATSGIETIKSSTLSTSSYSFPLRLSLEDPASIKFYNDLSLTSVADKLKRGQKLYAKLQLKDINGSIINTVDYPKYIQVDPTSLTFSIAGFLDVNEEVNGVIFSKETDYVYSIILSADSSFSENEITVNANYIPLYQL